MRKINGINEYKFNARRELFGVHLGDANLKMIETGNFQEK